MNINKVFGKMDYEEPEELSTQSLSELLEERKMLTKEEWNREFVGLWKQDLEDEMGIVYLLQSDPDVELKLGRNKLFWDGDKWVVLGRKGSVNSNYTLQLYEGESEVEAVKALKGDDNA